MPITLYQDVEMKQSRVTHDSSISSLEPGRVLACVIEGENWLLYDEANFTGSTRLLCSGTYIWGKAVDMDYDLRSIRPYPRKKENQVLVFEHPYFGGKMEEVTKEKKDIQAKSMIVVSGKWQMTIKERVGENLLNFASGEYTDLKWMGVTGTFSLLPY